MEMHERIAFIIENKKVTKTEFSKAIKVSQGFVSQLCSGTSSPSDRTIELICQRYGVNEVWLRTDEGDPFLEDTKEAEIMRFAVQVAKGSDEFKKALVAMLAKLDSKDWENLAKIYEKLSAEYKNG